MAHFAEIDSNNKVLRVVVGCNQDIANNGGELSEQAAEHFKTVCPLSSEGIKWVQTSYNNNFRKQYAFIGCTYDENLDKFINPQPYPSWILNENFDWKPNISSLPPRYSLKWDENVQKYFITKTSDQTIFEWNPENSTWIQL